jgi:DNA polymerase III subunit delta'
MPMEASDLRFTSLVGHEKAKTLLREAAAHNKMAHAYLFRGPDGVGKKKAALTLAAFLNCKKPVENDACGRCSSCRKYLSGNHPDLSIIEPEGKAIKINQIRELKHQLTFSPLEAKVRVVILEDINTMRREAANSLLKTLEEPAPGNLLILTADQRGDILSTILSRCQLIPFGPLDPEDMVQNLVQENGMDEATALTLASVSEGSFGRALFLWQENLLALRQEVIEALLLGEPLHQEEAVGRVFRLSEKAATLKENITELLDLLRLWYRDILLITAGGSESFIINHDLLEPLQTASHRWNSSQLQKKLQRLERAEKQLHRNCSRALVLETLFFDLI